MSDVVELSKKLNETIKESEFYRNYLTCRERLYEHPDLLRGLNEFKKEIQRSRTVALWIIHTMRWLHCLRSMTQSFTTRS